MRQAGTFYRHKMTLMYDLCSSISSMFYEITQRTGSNVIRLHDYGFYKPVKAIAFGTNNDCEIGTITMLYRDTEKRVVILTESAHNSRIEPPRDYHIEELTELYFQLEEIYRSVK